MRKLILLLLPIFLLTSCRTSTEPGDNPSSSAPKVGSTFSYDYAVIGQDNTKLDSGSIVTELVKTNETFAGKSNVLIYADNEGDFTHFAKESNGNISVYIDADASDNMGFVQPFWINFPISGSGGENRVLAQEQVDYQGVTATLRAVLTSEFAATESATIGNKSYVVKSANTNISLEIVVAGQVAESADILNGTLWWMPELNACYATQQEITGDERMTFVQELTGVNIK